MNVSPRTLSTQPQQVRFPVAASTREAASSPALLDHVDLKGLGSREPDVVSRYVGGLYGAVVCSELAMPVGEALAGSGGVLMYALGGAVIGGALGYSAGFKTAGLASVGAVGGAVVGGMTGGLVGRTVGAVAGAAVGAAASHIHLHHEKA